MPFRLTEGKFKTRDGLNLHYRYYQKAGASDTLLILHGHGEHSGRYHKFTKYLEDENLSIAMLDMRGYGLSDGEECYAENFDDFVHDFSEYVAFLKRDFFLKSKFLLLGHSFGGLTALFWALKHPDRLKALILSSPYLGLRLPLPLIMLNRVINRLAPHFVYQNPVYPPFLTHNPEELIRYKQDPLMRRKISARLLSEMMGAHSRLEAIPEFKFPFPVLVVMSGLDKVVDPSKTRLFYDKLEAPYKDLRVFEGFYHEIFNELGQEQVFSVLRGQLEASRPYMPA